MEFTNTLPPLNEVERMVFKAICESAQADTGGDFTYASETIKYTQGITMKQLRGYLSSLVKKDLIDVSKDHYSQICPTWTMQQGGRQSLCVEDFPEYFENKSS